MAAGHDLVILAVDAASMEAQLLLDELSDTLLRINGDSGRSSFDVEATTLRGGFYLARNAAGDLLGCAALRPLGEADSTIGELKRMYARPGAAGVGAALLAHVEAQARQHHYHALHLSTRVANGRAVAFYAKHGYAPVIAWGKYVGAAQSVCLGKTL
ncbi:GNAT family N-acetyltransferase [Janthinobacterium sp. PLB04]|uniref:GNAT family N-acetyltransferase n=1 Tax=Janthinobacterium lividum TaxID=29581 RepID=A0AAJ4T5H7_9BURK|nr:MULTISPECIES: GNAT family N-acetyltransferase [Janthinobacterium]KAB0330335.1 GNAT family N-acetyltransferase [Janthinobacterium lividum]QSX96544.1 GNAT family N-acetyltransferase [Janthinobacterium lividum]UGQ36435.1 GNAT family N-acetyltransferase [Janthinobacterium sp. PLB04]